MTENATDLFHAQLHKSQQPWINPVLLHLESDDHSVRALYEVEAWKAFGYTPLIFAMC